MKKHIISILLAAAMVLSLAACGNAVEGGNVSNGSETTAAAGGASGSSDDGNASGGDVSASGETTTAASQVEFDDDGNVVAAVKPAKYVYSTLGNDEKEIYDKILAGVQNFETSVDFGKAYPTETVRKVYRNVYFQEPEVFWFFADDVPFDQAADTMSVLPLEYRYSKETVATMQPDIDKAMNRIASKFPANATDVDKVIAIHDFIAGKTKFSKDDTFAKDAYGSLAGAYAQCEGYAKGFAYACNYFGIENCRITGTKYDGLSHAWSKVKINGKWYNVDVTWDDPEGTQGYFIRHNYMFVTDAAINNITHIVDCDFTPPVADGTDIDYYKYTGTYASTADEAVKIMQDTMIKNASSRMVDCQVKCSSKEVYDAAVKAIITDGGYKALMDKTNEVETENKIASLSQSNDDAFLILQLNLKYAEVE